MKKITLSIIALAITLTTFGQAPEGFKYQAVVRDAGNLILNNQAVGMRLTIQQGSIGGITVYQETFALTTNAYGLVNLEIGTGTTTDNFSNIDWSTGLYFIETAVDVNGGTTYSVMGTSQLMSVPYALYAKTSGSSTPGPQGPVGPAGLDGTNGTNGIDGTMGPQGPQGNVGATGPQGPIGLTGATGADGQGGVTTAGVGINVTGAGTVVSPYVVSTTSPCGLAIGQTYQGGIIFYLDPSGCHGLISASTDQSASPWDIVGYYDYKGYGSGLFEGKFNTFKIFWNQLQSNSAIGRCQNLTLGGFDDWYLPSVYELYLMYMNIGQGDSLGLGNVGTFSNAIYWSSTEFSTDEAWAVGFLSGSGTQYNLLKDSGASVRAVRAF